MVCAEISGKIFKGTLSPTKHHHHDPVRRVAHSKSGRAGFCFPLEIVLEILKEGKSEILEIWRRKRCIQCTYELTLAVEKNICNGSLNLTMVSTEIDCTKIESK